jgi:hypothetical protein
MKRKAMALTIILALCVSSVIGAQFTNSATAQTYSTIAIKPDGSIEGTNKIQQQGNVYTLTGDITGSIEVQKSNIVIDGAGHTLQGRKEVNERGVYLVGPDRSHPVCGNVLVKNLRIYNFFEGIFVLGASNNSIIGNYMDNSNVHLISSPNYTGDLIKHNTFRDAGIFVDYNRGGLDVITENNFINCGIYVGLSDAPIVDRNYWSDYTAKYPDAKELDGSGIWDTPYVDDRYAEDISCIDYHPLTRPVVIPDFPDSTTPTAEPSPTTSPEPNPSLTPSSLEPTPSSEPSPSPEPFPTTLVIGSVIAVAVIGLGFLVYFKKRKR